MVSFIVWWSVEVVAVRR